MRVEIPDAVRLGFRLHSGGAGVSSADWALVCFHCGLEKAGGRLCSSFWCDVDCGQWESHESESEEEDPEDNNESSEVWEDESEHTESAEAAPSVASMERGQGGEPQSSDLMHVGESFSRHSNVMVTIDGYELWGVWWIRRDLA